jgi:hypothetical protein
LTADTRSAAPSGSLSLARTLIAMPWAGTPAAVSFAATGRSFTGVIVIETNADGDVNPLVVTV